MIYIGTKRVEATPETKNGEAGYKVVYPDGYVSLSPAATFEQAYRGSGQMSFGHALLCLAEGEKVYRAGWAGKDMFLFLVEGSTFEVNRPPLLGIFPEGHRIDYNAHIDIKTADGSIAVWTPSQVDMLASDWHIF